MIGHQHRFIFFDIVKTGGSSVNQLLRKHGGVGKHHSVARPLPKLPENAALDRILKPELIYITVRTN